MPKALLKHKEGHRGLECHLSEEGEVCELFRGKINIIILAHFNPIAEILNLIYRYNQIYKITHTTIKWTESIISSQSLLRIIKINIPSNFRKRKKGKSLPKENLNSSFY